MIDSNKINKIKNIIVIEKCVIIHQRLKIVNWQSIYHATLILIKDIPMLKNQSSIFL